MNYLPLKSSPDFFDPEVEIERASEEKVDRGAGREEVDVSDPFPSLPPAQPRRRALPLRALGLPVAMIGAFPLDASPETDRREGTKKPPP